MTPPDQPSLFGLDEAAKPTDRLFLGIFPDAAAADIIAGVARRMRDELGLTGRPLATDRFHVTLFDLGLYAGVRQDIVAAAIQAAGKLAAPSFELTFDRAASFDNRSRNNPFVLQGGEGLAALIAFRQALGRELAMAGLQRLVKAQYVPHVTLLYDARVVTERPIDPISWKAGELVLIHSLVGQTRHIPLARWPLKEAS